MKQGIVDLFKEAKANGLTTSLDLQWDPENKWDFPYQSCLPFVDVFLPNEAEILLLSGESELDKALEKIGRFAHLIIVKQGDKGALAYHQGKVVASQPFLHDCFVDAIGAGDSFNAGFIIRYLDGCSLEASLEFASLAGAVNTTASGGTAAFESITSFKRRSKEIFRIEL
jgi:sugar/nucleoside kinase (ribokinase family)